ncbi:MAG TPA: magnesium-translocating P-type ATPase, partial [Bryobacteraceae bacterium]|nr:magnesium-translocating P-type ATPase [Bryobacteraceae bacterium]
MRYQGLSSVEAVRLLEAVGPNAVESGRRITLWHSFLSRLRNPLVLVLIAAAFLSASTGNAQSAVIIVAIVGMSASLDIFQEHRAGDAADRLRASVALTCRVVRDGQESSVPSAELVPGDLVILSAGDLVPADGVLISALDFFVNEALLTGESFPVEKKIEENKGAKNKLWMGSSVISGAGTVKITSTGSNTQFGGIAHRLGKSPPPSSFVIGLQNFSALIVRLTLLMVLATLLVNLLLHRPIAESFLFAIALAVGLTPELLPMIVSVTLARGAIRLSRREVIVKHLSTIHDLGSMDVLCSDKTGTLTEATISLVRQVDTEGRPSPLVLKLAQINARFETGLKSPLDQAILASAGEDISSWRKLDEVPFDFERRRVSVLAGGEGKRLVIVKGAPEDILTLCSHCQPVGGQPLELDEDRQTQIRRDLQRMGKEGIRVLAVAFRVADPGCMSAQCDKRDMTFAGILGFLDPPKRGAGEALGKLRDLGVAIKIVTGDAPDVAVHVCRDLGLDASEVLTGTELAAMSDEALAARLSSTTIFCRMTPSQKLRVLSALRRQGHVVGYLGDGINDAPALHEADIGFSIDSAADVAKEAAGIILLRKDLGVLAEGVREGRRTYANILKYIMMASSSNFGNMFSMAGGALLLPFLPMLPLQILLNNLLYDFSEIAIPMDGADPALIARPHRWKMADIRRFMFFFGPFSSLFD